MLLQWKADSLLSAYLKYVVFHLQLRLHALITAYWYEVQYRSIELDALRRGRRTHILKKKGISDFNREDKLLIMSYIQNLFRLKKGIKDVVRLEV
jgi:hypothetical protein